MSEMQKVLILDVEKVSRGRTPELGLSRTKALNSIAAVGGKVLHDSGGRLIVVDVPESAEARLAERLPDARLVPLKGDMLEAAAGLDPSETLFLQALKIRTSQWYRDAKSRRKVGETPEEQALVSGPCVREGY